MIRDLIKPIITHLKLVLLIQKWRKCNKHNYTIPNNIFPIDKVRVGYKSYGKLNVMYYGNKNERLEIGRYCCIANDVKFILGGEHHPEFITNYLFKYYLTPENSEEDRKSKGPIIIEDDVWIGTNAIILSGVKIGRGAIIAAGSIVSKDVEPYCIYTTNKIIKYRFSKDIIDELLRIDFNKIDFEFVKDNMDIFYSSDIDSIVKDSKISQFKHSE